MSFWGSLRAVWRQPPFRRLFIVRVLSQGADATLQVGMASYILFSPQAQPDARAIFAMLAITLLPFSVVGPFVGVVLDRFSRRTIAMTVDSVRALVAVTVAATVLSGARGPGATVFFYAALLLAMSLSRFLLAGLAAALPFVVGENDYLAANSVAPVVGPLGAVLAGVAMLARVLVSGVGHASTRVGDGLIFGIAAVLFVASVLTSSGFTHDALGPGPDAPRSTFGAAARGLTDALHELRRKAFAGAATLAIAAQRIVFGLVQVATILLFRNHVHTPDTVTAALADIGVWAGFTGAGFLTASVLAGPLLTRIGLRRGIVVILVANAAIQIVPGSLLGRATLWAAAFGLGICAQGLKIAVDTVTQAVVDDEVKGRVFVVYDIVFNVANVLAAALAIFLVPSDGFSIAVFVAAAACYLVVAVCFGLGTRRLPRTPNLKIA